MAPCFLHFVFVSVKNTICTTPLRLHVVAGGGRGGGGEAPLAFMLISHNSAFGTQQIGAQVFVGGGASDTNALHGFSLS